MKFYCRCVSRNISIVTEILKDRIFILIDASEELSLYADFKCTIFIKFNFTHQKLRTWENLPDF